MQEASTPAPGMSEAMAIVTARLQSMEKKMSMNDYVDVMRSVYEEGHDPLIITSALASLAVAFANIAVGTKGDMTAEQLLQTVGLTLQG